MLWSKRKNRLKKIIFLWTWGIIFLLQPLSVISIRAETTEEDDKISGYEKAVQNENRTPSGIPYDRLQAEIDQFIEARKEGCASVSVAVFKNDQTLYSRQYGFTDMAHQVPVDEDTVYEWGSVSKLMVWTSVMQLYEQGEIDLKKDIREYLPEGFLSKLSYDEPITMINLMNHNAGWQETTYDVEVKDASEIVDLETALYRTQPPQIYKPGEVTAYSNWGTALGSIYRAAGKRRRLCKLCT